MAPQDEQQPQGLTLINIEADKIMLDTLKMGLAALQMNAAATDAKLSEQINAQLEAAGISTQNQGNVSPMPKRPPGRSA